MALFTKMFLIPRHLGESALLRVLTDNIKSDSAIHGKADLSLWSSSMLGEDSRLKEWIKALLLKFQNLSSRSLPAVTVSWFNPSTATPLTEPV